MKNLLYYLLSIALINYSIVAMDAPQTPLLKIANDSSNGKVEIIHQEEGAKKPSSFTLEPGEEPRRVENPLSLVLVNVVPYGQARSYISAETFTLGYKRPENLADKIKSEIRKSNNHKITLVIKPGGQGITAYLGKGMLGQFAEKVAKEVSYYNYEFLPYIKKTEKEASPFIFAQFPQVEKAQAEGRKIAPHYFFGIGAKAAPNVVKGAYDSLVKEWTAAKDNPQDPKHKLAKTALEFIYSAYNAMTQGGDAEREFNAKVEDELDAPLIH